MLINDTSFIWADPVRHMMASILNPRCTELRTGVYDIGLWLSSPVMDGWEQYPDGLKYAYGVADNVEQILAAMPELEESDRQFVVTIVPVLKSEQSPDGGWRWHKWGAYIGDFEPKHEYLYDEEGIDGVLTFQVYEKLT